jgi:hypothetical protein
MYGVTTILHTHLRSLDFHPHIHVVMPGAGINLKTGLWRVKKMGYLFSHKALAKEDYAERVKIVPYDDGWPGFEEKVLKVQKISKITKGYVFSKFL